MSEAMVSTVLQEAYLIENIRESARRLCRIPDRTASPPKRLTGKLEELAAEVVNIALQSDLERPDTSQPYWRPRFNINVIRNLRLNGADQLIARYTNSLDGSFPAISVRREQIETELRLVAVSTAETTLLLAFDLDPRLLYWSEKDTKFQRALAMALQLGVMMVFIMESTNQDEPGSSDNA